MSRQAQEPSSLAKLLLIQATRDQASVLHRQLLAGAAATLRVPGCTVCQVHASRRSAQHWIVQLQWRDQQALQQSIDTILQPLLQQLFDSGALRALQVFGSDDAFVPLDLLDDILPLSRAG